MQGFRAPALTRPYRHRPADGLMALASLLASDFFVDRVRVEALQAYIKVREGAGWWGNA